MANKAEFQKDDLSKEKRATKETENAHFTAPIHD